MAKKQPKPETPAAMIRRAVRMEEDAIVMCQDAKALRIEANRIKRARALAKAEAAR